MAASIGFGEGTARWRTLCPSCGDFRTSTGAAPTIFADAFSQRSVIVILLLLALSPLLVQAGWMSRAGSTASSRSATSPSRRSPQHPGGFTGQISIGHAVFFGFGAFARLAEPH